MEAEKMDGLPLPPGARAFARFGEIRVALLPDFLDPAVSHAHQWILISHQGGGERLAALLCPDMDLVAAAARDAVWIWVAHDRPVDDVLMGLFRFVAAVRMAAPDLVGVQLSLEQS